MLNGGNDIVMYEGYGFGSGSKRRASGKQTAARKRFSSCAKHCRGGRGYGGCMKTCLRSKTRR